MKYAFITQQKKARPVDRMCQMPGVSRKAYYRYEQRRKSNVLPGPDRQIMIEVIKKTAQETRFTYGTRRMQSAPAAPGHFVGRHKTRTLMREAGVKTKRRRKYKVTTQSNHKLPVFENVLNRKFMTMAPNVAYVSDITYIWTEEGWLYLAVFIDLFSRRVVGWSMDSRMKSKLVVDALRMASGQRYPSKGLIVHSGQGGSVRQQSLQGIP